MQEQKMAKKCRKQNTKITFNVSSHKLGLGLWLKMARGPTTFIQIFSIVPSRCHYSNVHRSAACECVSSQYNPSHTWSKNWSSSSRSGVSRFFCKRPDSKYIRFYRLTSLCTGFCTQFCLQHAEAITDYTKLNGHGGYVLIKLYWKQTVGRIWLTDCSPPTPGLDHTKKQDGINQLF